jgi:hypothetical protein
MNQITIDFDSGLQLVYKLTDSESAEFFASAIQSLTPADICDTSFKNGFDSEALISNRVDRFYQVAEAINHRYPQSVDIVPLEPDWRSALQKMHTHFPSLTHSLPASELQTMLPLLGEFNDLIHWLEKELNRKHTGSPLDKSWATICLDFNRARHCRYQPVPDSDYQYFTHELYFGNLHLHYANVGRHPWELFGSKDYICPAHQVISQNQISPSCNLYFNDWDLLRHQGKVLAVEEYTATFDRFYHDRGGQDFFGFALDDPRLAVGYLKIGELVNLDEFATVQARDQLRSQLAQSQPVGWTVING